MYKRPFRVTLSAWLVLLLTAWNAVRLWTAVAWWDVLVESSARQPPIITALSGAFWFVIGLILLWGILVGKAWAGKMLIAAAAGYSIWYWIERLIWQEPRPNWPFVVILNLIVLVLFFFTTKSMTRETHERKNKNPTLE
jgi:hypothetical protein